MAVGQYSCFSSLMDIDKLIHQQGKHRQGSGFSSLMDIDKLIRTDSGYAMNCVLVL